MKEEERGREGRGGRGGQVQKVMLITNSQERDRAERIKLKKKPSLENTGYSISSITLFMTRK